MTVVAARNSKFGMALLVMANGLAVSSLYWAQSVIGQATQEFGPSVLILGAPGATLLGYALGVAALATLSRDLAGRGGLARHGVFLAFALCLVALAPNAVCVALACLAVGAGCAMTQRLMVIATTLVAPTRQSQAIGMIISAGLFGIMVARAFITEFATALGWRQMFLTDAGVSLVICLAAAWVSPSRRTAPVERLTLPSPIALLRDVPTLRRAAIQQAVAFAAFNMGWSIFPAATHASSGARAAIATAGACAALASGRACRKWAPDLVARSGFAAVVTAAGLVALILSAGWPTSSVAIYTAMLLLELGTQIALVANQARAQATTPSVPVRGRLAAILTTIAFTGGAVGAALGNLLR